MKLVSFILPNALKFRGEKPIKWKLNDLED